MSRRTRVLRLVGNLFTREAFCALAAVILTVVMLPVAAEAQNAYIVTNPGNTASVVSTLTDQIVATITVGPTEFYGAVAVSPDGTNVYIAVQAAGGSVAVIDTATNTVATTITLGDGVQSLAVSPDGSKVYAATFDGMVFVIDASSSGRHSPWQAGQR